MLSFLKQTVQRMFQVEDPWAKDEAAYEIRMAQREAEAIEALEAGVPPSIVRQVYPFAQGVIDDFEQRQKATADWP